MLPLLCAFALAQFEPLTHDSSGVPHIKALNEEQAMFFAGYATAQDRLWQMEKSRRAAKGRLAEVFGPQFADSDTEVLKNGYTDQELDEQIAGLSLRLQRMLKNYSMGVNFWMLEAQWTGYLPPEYAAAGFEPEPWTPTDSAAIAVSLFQRFGRGGAGELRNLGALEYLKTQPVKDRVLDVVDDFLWQNDPRAPVTADQPGPAKGLFPNPTRKQTEAHLASLPKLSIFELLPAIRLAERTDSTLAAESLAVPYKVGSYAMVVAPSRSKTGNPLVLTGPQMGFTIPSIVHEMSIECPTLRVRGADIPGAPGVIVGNTADLAWALTSGVADTDDIFYAKESDAKVQGSPRRLKVRGEADRIVNMERTPLGPVVLKAQGYVFSRRSSYWMRELQAMDALAGLYNATGPADVERTIAKSPMSFNVLYGSTRGDIGYVFAGDVPIRASMLDPRFPTLYSPSTDWRGMIPKSNMPHVRNPREGVLTNWNNKPAAWWQNMDSPVWGQVQHVERIRSHLTAPKLTIEDLQATVAGIAQEDEFWPQLFPLVQLSQATAAHLSDDKSEAAAQALATFDGKMILGSLGATVYLAFLDGLRDELFLPFTGNFVNPDLFRTVTQPSLILNALQGKTLIDYRKGRPLKEVFQAALAKAVAKLPDDRAKWAFVPGRIPVPSGEGILYRNRGTYIQITELMKDPKSMNVVTPGVAERGSHAGDQAALAREFKFKPMIWWP